MMLVFWIACSLQSKGPSPNNQANEDQDNNIVEDSSVGVSDTSAQISDSAGDYPPDDTADEPDDPNPTINPCEQVVLLEAYGAANRLWVYDLETSAHSQVLTPQCNGMTALSANNKGDIFGLAHASQEIFKIDPTTGQCLQQSLIPPASNSDVQIRGLAFVELNDIEVMYLSALETQSDLQALLFKVEEAQLELVASLNNMVDEKAFIDLAGTNTGRLFGLHPSSGGSVIKEWNPENGEQINNFPTMAPAPEGWSFVWHEDAFTLFISTRGNHTSVYNFDPNTGALVSVTEMNFQVVGAALSACAPDSSGS